MSRSAAKSRGEKPRAGSVPVPPPPPPSAVEVVDIIPGRLTENAWVAMTTQEEGDEVVAEIIADLKSTVLDKCYEQYIEKQLVPYTAFWACSSLVETVNWLFLARDEGEMAESAPLWAEDSETVASPGDSWAEGCVPVHYSWVSSHTPLLQKLLDFNSVESTDLRDLQRKSRSPTRQELHKRRVPTPTTPRRTAEPATTAESDPERPPVHTASSETPQRRTLQSQLHPTSPHKATPPPRGRRKPLPHNPRNVSRSPGISKGNLLTCKTQPPQHIRRTGPLYKKLDPALLPVSCYWPEVEVLEPCPSLQRNGGLTARLQPNQQHGNRGTSASVSPRIHHQGLPSVRRRSVIHKPQRPILHAGAQQNSFPLGFTPLFAGLSLDTMELGPGFSLRDPTVGRSGPGREDPPWLPPMPELKPIRSSLPPLLWSLDEVVTGHSPGVNPPTS
ncbi:serine/arginine repetitive matrix protein 1-like [Osmerus eperlanus]|uniref:serine/arginine repetitive matrix protein 1-like n=1 Tax=Osmerus eperlanus TaxID=29151 RepID=UPI002E0ED39F